MSIAKGGLSWIATSSVLAICCMIGAVVSTGVIRSVFLFLSILLVLLVILFVVFFRDPERDTGDGVVAVADGRIREITHGNDSDVGECIVVSTFMNLHNVHVNRMPLDGTVKKLIHHPGGHLPAFRKESEKNERVIVLLKTEIGMVKVIQIAGTVARRIVPYIHEGDTLKKGEKIGLIRLGSRVDVVLPAKAIKQVTVTLHKRIRAGEDTIAQLYD